MRIALLGVRGVPALYSGFETAATEILTRLAARGHDVTVYCRRGYGDETQQSFQGIRKRYLPSLPIKIGETLSHTLLGLLDVARDPPDVLIIFNPANSPLFAIPLIMRIPYAVNVDGLEWRRGKWPLFGRAYLYFACWLCARTAPWIIADSRAIQRFYRDRWKRDSYFATYGTHLVESREPALLAEYGLQPKEYFLVVARLEPENNTDLIIRAFSQVRTTKQLLIVGDTRYRSQYVEKLRAETRDPRVYFAGGIYDRRKLNEIMCNCYAYVHGHVVGGTNPVLLEALGSGCCVMYLDHDYHFNREVVGGAGIAFERTTGDLSRHMQDLIDHPEMAESLRNQARDRVRLEYSWDTVADQYEKLCFEMLLRRRRKRLDEEAGVMAVQGQIDPTAERGGNGLALAPRATSRNPVDAT